MPSVHARSSSEEDRAGTGSVNLDVTRRTVFVLSVLIVLWSGRFYCPNIMRYAMTFKTQLTNLTHSQHARIRGAVRHVTGSTAFGLDWCVLISERALLIRMTLDTCRINTGAESRLFGFESAVRIVTVAAAHRSFQHLVM